MSLFNTALYQPFLNGLIYLYDHLGHNLGWAIIVFTLIIKLILAWPSALFIRSQKKMQELQPKLNAIKERLKNDREAQAKATMELYRNSKVNPLSSCLPTLIQIPILIALYQVFFGGLQTDPQTHLLLATKLKLLYGPLRSIYDHTPIQTVFFPGLDLARRGIFAGSIVLAALAGGLQFWQSRMLLVSQPPKVPGAKDESMAATTSKQMMYVFPILSVVIILRLPIGLGLYWVVNSLFTIVQQYLLLRAKKTPVAETTDAH